MLVDDDAHAMLDRHTWYIMFSGPKKKPYAFTEIFSRTQGKRMVYMHHLVLGGYCMTDHENGNTLDNQFHNLREATASQNGANARKMASYKGKPCTSKYKGVTFAQGKFRSVIRKEGKTYQLGSFTDEADAALAYNAKAVELYGEYAHLNQVG